MVVLFVLLLIGLWLYCVLDVLGTPPEAVQFVPKPVWLGIVLLFPDVGSVLWLLVGRPRASAAAEGSWGEHPSFGGDREHTRRPWGDRPIWPPGLRRGDEDSDDEIGTRPRRARRNQPVAPDDDPEFLRELSERIRRDGDNPRR